MKKTFSLLIVLFILMGFQQPKEDYSPAVEEIPFEKYIPLADNPIHTGNLILVNKEKKLQSNPTELAAIPKDIASNVIVNDQFLVAAHIMEPLKQLFAKANEEKIQHFIINSAFRGSELQQQLYLQKGPDLALPAGHSEHQSALALDIGSTLGLMQNTMEGKWLAENAHVYGFVLRYPEHKTDITGIAYEPWHFRYVGLPHSVLMKENDYVLEEYIAFLQAEEELAYTYDGVDYLIQYVPLNGQLKMSIARDYWISGDNDGGYIVTSTEK